MGAETAEALVKELESAIAAAAERLGTRAIKPGHRIPFHWPPHPVSGAFHVLPSEWKGRIDVEMAGETFEVLVATTPDGVFGRCDALWLDVRGDSLEAMKQALADAAEPLFRRQRIMAECLGLNGGVTRFKGQIRDLGYGDLLRLLYCPDRDVANDARIEIETHASAGIFAPALIAVLNDRRHPHRRSAQWCVLDLFEDLESFCHTQDEKDAAIRAMHDLIWSAEDDFARTTFKAGVVLGGHLPSEVGGPVLLGCLQAPSRIGRRSAIHGLFHVVEWKPEFRDRTVEALRMVAQHDPEPLLRQYAREMADDIEAANYDHHEEPQFDDEL